MNARVLAGIAVVVLAAAAGYYYFFATPKAVQLGDIKKYVFVQSTTKPEIAVVDATEDVLVARLPIAAVADTLLVAKEPKRVIYANRASKSLHIYDIATQADEKVIELPFSPDNVVISPDSFVLVATGNDTGQLAIVNLDSGTLERVLETTFHKPSGVVFSGDSLFVHITDSLNGQVLTVDVLSGFVLDPIKISLSADAAADPQGTAVSALTRTPNSLFGLLTHRTTGELSIVAMRNWSEMARLPVGRGAVRPYGTADGAFMLVANAEDRTVSVISSENWTVAATLPGLSGVTSLSTGFFEEYAFVISNTENKVAVIDLPKLETVKFLDLPGGPGLGITDADGKKLYIPLHDSGGLAVIDIYNQKVSKIIENVIDSPWGVAMAATNNYCH